MLFRQYWAIAFCGFAYPSALATSEPQNRTLSSATMVRTFPNSGFVDDGHVLLSAVVSVKLTAAFSSSNDERKSTNSGCLKSLAFPRVCKRSEAFWLRRWNYPTLPLEALRASKTLRCYCIFRQTRLLIPFCRFKCP